MAASEARLLASSEEPTVEVERVEVELVVVAWALEVMVVEGVVVVATAAVVMEVAGMEAVMVAAQASNREPLVASQASAALVQVVMVVVDRAAGALEAA